MGRAARKNYQQTILQQYRDAGWDEESLRIWFGGELPSRGEKSLFFRHPRETVSRLLAGESVSPAEYEEVLLEGNFDRDYNPKDLLHDPVFEQIFQQELERLCEVDELRGDKEWPLELGEDRLCEEFAKLLPGPHRLLEAAAEIDPASFEKAARDIENRKILNPTERRDWAREEFASRAGLQSILDKRGSREWSAARHQYLVAVYDTILKESGSPWAGELGFHLAHFRGLLRRGGGLQLSQDFAAYKTKEGLLQEEELFRDAVGGFLEWGVFHERPSIDVVVARIVPLLSRQIFSQLLGKAVTDTESAAQEIADQFFFPGVRRKETEGWPFESLRPIFRAEENNQQFAFLFTQYRNNRVWPTRDAARNAQKILQAVEEASEDYLRSGPPAGSWSLFLADRISKHVMH